MSSNASPDRYLHRCIGACVCASIGRDMCANVTRRVTMELLGGFNALLLVVFGPEALLNEVHRQKLCDVPQLVDTTWPMGLSHCFLDDGPSTLGHANCQPFSFKFRCCVHCRGKYAGVQELGALRRIFSERLWP